MAKAPAPAPAPAPKKKLLIVDDDREHGENLRKSVENMGYSARFITNPAEAFQNLANERFDALLLDYWFSEGGTSIRLVEHLHSNASPLNLGIPILLMSGGLDHGVVEATKGKVFSMIVKPIDLRILGARLKEAMVATRVRSPKKKK